MRVGWAVRVDKRASHLSTEREEGLVFSWCADCLFLVAQYVRQERLCLALGVAEIRCQARRLVALQIYGCLWRF